MLSLRTLKKMKTQPTKRKVRYMDSFNGIMKECYMQCGV